MQIGAVLVARDGAHEVVGAVRFQTFLSDAHQIGHAGIVLAEGDDGLVVQVEVELGIEHPRSEVAGDQVLHCRRSRQFGRSDGRCRR